MLPAANWPALDAAAAGLCPPPAVLEGREVSADVARLADRQTLFRRTRFLPLRRPDEAIVCIVALVDPQDRADPLEPTAKTTDSTASESRESQELHVQLQHFRQQMALRYRIERVVGVTPAVRRARAQAHVAAATRANVVLIGTAGQRPPAPGRSHPLLRCRPNRAAGWCRWNAALLDVELLQSTLRSAAAEKHGGTPAAVRCRSALRREPGGVGRGPVGCRLSVARAIDRRHARCSTCRRAGSIARTWPRC